MLPVDHVTFTEGFQSLPLSLSWSIVHIVCIACYLSLHSAAFAQINYFWYGTITLILGVQRWFLFYRFVNIPTKRKIVYYIIMVIDYLMSCDAGPVCHASVHSDADENKYITKQKKSVQISKTDCNFGLETIQWIGSSAKSDLLHYGLEDMRAPPPQ